MRHILTTLRYGNSIVMRSSTRAALLGFPLAALVAAFLAACSASSEPAANGSTTEATVATEQVADTAETVPKAAATKLRIVKVASGLDSPIFVTATASEPSRLYVVEQAGRVRVLEGGRLLSSPFLDICCRQRRREKQD